MKRTTENKQTKRDDVPQAGIPEMSSASEVNQLLGNSDFPRSDRPVFLHRRVRAGQHLVRAGDEFNDLYVVNGGFFKTVNTDASGNEQVMGFPMCGALVGAEGICSRFHHYDVVALSDADVIVISFDDLGSLSQLAPGIEASLFRAISQQLVEKQSAASAIGSLCAETRLARFLIRLGDQMEQHGYSRDTFILRMSRQDLGNYLGMKIETVSRTLTVLAGKGQIKVSQREIQITDRDTLEQIAQGGPGRKVRLSNQKKAAKTKAPAGKQSRRQRPNLAMTSATPWSGLVDMVASAEPATV